MALDFFYTLKEKKKTRILDAIEKCMQTSEYEKLSINDIAEEADISRGSFYNYFVDKNDAVETLVREKISYISDVFKSSIINNNYSLFDGIYFGYFQIKDTLQKNIFMTIINNLKFFIDTGIKIAYSKEYEGEFAKNIDWLIENTIEGKEILNTREKMESVLDIIVSLITNLLLKIIISNNSDYNDTFNFKFNIIKAGIYNLKESQKSEH